MVEDTVGNQEEQTFELLRILLLVCNDRFQERVHLSLYGRSATVSNPIRALVDADVTG
jgi:hypothetical protein